LNRRLKQYLQPKDAGEKSYLRSGSTQMPPASYPKEP